MNTLDYKTETRLQVSINLPISKSVLNRELILAASSGTLLLSIATDGLADDSLMLLNALKSQEKTINIGHAGTAMRFLTAHFASVEGEHLLQGSSRMHERPIKILVDALRELGADIRYAGKEGFPPLEIRGKKLKGGKVSISGAVSSQYISALLLCGSSFKNGLDLELLPPVTSRPYIGLTLAAMKRAGIIYSLEGNRIRVEPSEIICTAMSMERDWSAAAFAYGLVSQGCCDELILPGLDVKTWQGDSIIGQLFVMLGVETGQSEIGVHLSKKTKAPSSFSRDMRDCPDLAQAIVFTCAALGISCNLWGLQTLPLKETDRIRAMVDCLKIVGIHAEYGKDFIRFQGHMNLEKNLHFKTYGDHRMAMSLALWAPVLHQMQLDDPDVVSKSFPSFWEEVKKLGLSIH
mgnify:CR=1 FL=1